MTKQQIIEIIAARDNITWTEAEEAIDECVAEIYDTINSYDSFAAYDIAVELMQSELGLEPDYIDILLG